MRCTQQAQDILLRLSKYHLLSLLFDQLPRNTVRMVPVLPGPLESSTQSCLEGVAGEPAG